MIIQLTAEEVTRIVTNHLKNNIAGLEAMDYEAGVGLINGELSMVVAIEQPLDQSIFDNQDDEDEEDNTSEPENLANGEDKPAKGKSKGTGKRTRRTRAQIEEDERREREQAQANQKEQGKETPVVAPVETQTEVPADEIPPFAVDEPEFGELEREAAAPEVVEEPKDENLFGTTEPTQEPVKEEVSSDASLFDTGATNNPFAEPGDAVAESSDTNLFNVDPVEGDSEFQKPAEDNTEVFNLFK